MQKVIVGMTMSKMIETQVRTNLQFQVVKEKRSSKHDSNQKS